MPNWVYNEIRFKSEDDCKKVAELMKSNDSDFNFNNAIVSLASAPHLTLVP